jgi:hypothetical protein
MNVNIFLLTLGLLILLSWLSVTLKEAFSSYPFSPARFSSSYPFQFGLGGAFINIPTRFTRNQSYDLRGDPVVIRPDPFLSPWGISGYI